MRRRASEDEPCVALSADEVNQVAYKALPDPDTIKVRPNSVRHARPPYNGPAQAHGAPSTSGEGNSKAPGLERTYQSLSGAYSTPNDNEEMDGLELQHRVWLELLGGQYHMAPLAAAGGGAVRDVLDVGAGAGNWALGMARTLPRARVTGIDLSVAMAGAVTSSSSPEAQVRGIGIGGGGHESRSTDDKAAGTRLLLPNCRFLERDALKPWDLPPWRQRPSSSSSNDSGCHVNRDDNGDDDGDDDGLFDYIHTRALLTGITDWEGLVDRMVAHLRPGGWVEMQEFRMPIFSPDGSLKEGSAASKFNEMFVQSTAALGVDCQAALKHAPLLRAAGLTRMRHVRGFVPWGPWAVGEAHLQRAGLMARRDVGGGGLDAIARSLFLRGGGFDPAVVDDVLERTRAEIVGNELHCGLILDITFGQKPFE